jgi:tellurite resistance protein
MLLASLNHQQKETFLCLAHNVVVSDGDLATGEREKMAEMRTEMTISDDYKPHYVAIAGIGEIFHQRRSRVIALIALIQLGYADGAYEIEERCVITEVAKEFAVSANWVERSIALQAEVIDFL